MTRGMNETQQHTEKTTGRPKTGVSKKTLESLISTYGFSAKECAQYLNVSNSTVARLLREYGLGIKQKYSEISDADLDMEVREVVRWHQDIGYRVCARMLKAKGITVPVDRMRLSLLRVDPEGVASRCPSRWLTATSPAVDDISQSEEDVEDATGVPGPSDGAEQDGSEASCTSDVVMPAEHTVPTAKQCKMTTRKSVWHLDSVHKLQRYKFTVHVAIDSCCQTILYLKVSDNNQQATVLHYFKKAVNMHGLPGRVETGQREENITVDRYMLQRRRGNFRTPVRGRSRVVEKLEDNLTKNCLKHFIGLFHVLESQGHMSVDSNVDVFALHFVFRNRIQERLDDFQRHHNSYSKSMKTWRSGNADRSQGEVAVKIQGSLPMSDQINVLIPEEFVELGAGLGASQDSLGIDLYLWTRERAKAFVQLRENSKGLQTAVSIKEDVKPQLCVFCQEDKRRLHLKFCTCNCE